jgi:rieske iron-sulfur protein
MSAHEGNVCVARRGILRSLCGWAGTTAFVSISAPLRLLGATDERESLPRPGDVLVFAKGDKKGQVINPNDLVLDAPPVLARPKDSSSGAVHDQTDKNLILVLRANPNDIASDLQARSADGILAYSAVCTHMGCVVEDWDSDRKCLRCPCHKGTYDPRQQGKVVSGPPPRPLPVLPLKLQNGVLVVADVFSTRVGI